MSAARVFQELAALEAAVQGPAEAEWQRVHQQLANSPIFADNTCDRAASAESDPSGQHSHACGCALVKAEAVVGSAERTCALLLRAQTHFRLKVLPACIADAAAALSSCLNTTGAMLADFHPSDPGAGAEEEGAEGREVQLSTQNGMPLLCAAACTLAMACCSTRAWGEARDACVAAGQDLCALLKGDEEEVVKAKRHHMLMHHGCRCHRVRELREKCDEILSSAPAAGLAEGARIEQDVGGEGGDGEGEKETAGAHADKPRWKYPRTQHLCDPGGTAVSRDDLLMDPRDVQVRVSVCLSVRLSVCVCVCVCACVCAWMYERACMYVCMCVYGRVYACLHVCVSPLTATAALLFRAARAGGGESRWCKSRHQPWPGW
jgi:hypothetical protein